MVCRLLFSEQLLTYISCARLRALSTPDATTPIPASGGSSSGNIFKFSTTKYRYSKDQILALRANVTERLAEEVRNEILENLRDVESVFRPNIIEPLALTAPSSEETVNSLVARCNMQERPSLTDFRRKWVHYQVIFRVERRVVVDEEDTARNNHSNRKNQELGEEVHCPMVVVVVVPEAEVSSMSMIFHF